jgi:hypothetical protein
MSAIILPTHHCFDDALDIIAARAHAEFESARHLVLVHGICLIPEGPREGEPFSHAWVEDRDEVWQGGLFDGETVAYAMSTGEFEALLRVQERTRYSLREAWEENCRTGTYGPWVEKYRALCRKEEEAA